MAKRNCFLFWILIYFDNFFYIFELYFNVKNVFYNQFLINLCLLSKAHSAIKDRLSDALRDESYIQQPHCWECLQFLMSLMTKRGSPTQRDVAWWGVFSVALTRGASTTALSRRDWNKQLLGVVLTCQNYIHKWSILLAKNLVFSWLSQVLVVQPRMVEGCHPPVLN